MEDDSAAALVPSAEVTAPGNGTDGGDDAGTQQGGQAVAVKASSRRRSSAIFDSAPGQHSNSKRRFHPQFTPTDQDAAARLIQKTYRGALDRRDIQRRLRIQERLKGGPEKPWNFEIDGVRYMFAERALCGLTPQNR